MLNIAIIGLGWWGRTHIDAIHNKSDKVKIVRVIDLNTEGSNYQDALDDPDVNAVVLVTPHSLHTEQIIAAAEAGKHVFTEKPFALNKSDAEKSVLAAEKAGIKLGLGHNQRYAAPQTEIKKMIDSNQLGTIMHLEGNTSHSTLSGFVSWRHDPKEAPGGGLYHMGSHYIDLFSSFLALSKFFSLLCLFEISSLNSSLILLKDECLFDIPP